MPQIKEKPTEAWDKFYSVYMFDEIKYHKLCKEYPTKDRAELKAQCFVLDENGERVPLGDEKHIFRIQVLHKIQSELADYCKSLKTHINYWDRDCSASVVCGNYTLFYERWDKGTYTYGNPTLKKTETTQTSLFDVSKPTNEYRILNAWEYYAVEINNTWQLPIKTRVLLHLKVLKLCRLGEPLDKAVKFVLKHTKI